MEVKKYPVGTPIKYIGCCKDCKNKTGKIVKVFERCCYVNLPESSHCPKSTSSVYAKWSEIIPLKNHQYLFDFAEEL